MLQACFCEHKTSVISQKTLVVPTNLGQSRSIIQQLYPRLLLQQGCLFLKTNVKSQLIEDQFFIYIEVRFVKLSGSSYNG